MGNLAESGAIQTLELRCGHSMAKRRAARRTETLAPPEVGKEGLRRLRLRSLLAGRSADGGYVPSLASQKAKASGRRVFSAADSRSPAPENVEIRHPGPAVTLMQGFPSSQAGPALPWADHALRPSSAPSIPEGWGLALLGRWPRIRLRS